MAKVAIIEDNEIQRELCAAVLAAGGYDVTVFDSGEAFLDSHQKFDVIVIDLVLGKGMHGVTLIREILRANRTARCIAMTGSDPTLRGTALLTGALLALPKPVPIHALVLAVQLALVL